MQTFLLSLFFSIFLLHPLTPNLTPKISLPAHKNIYFVKVSTRREARSGSQVMGFILYQVIHNLVFR